MDLPTSCEREHCFRRPIRPDAPTAAGHPGSTPGIDLGPLAIPRLERLNAASLVEVSRAWKVYKSNLAMIEGKNILLDPYSRPKSVGVGLFQEKCPAPVE